MRPLLVMWVAAPAVCAMAYITAFSPAPTDNFFVLLHWMAVALALVLLWCCCRPFMGRLPFDMSYWAAGFPTTALAGSAMYYYA